MKTLISGKSLSKEDIMKIMEFSQEAEEGKLSEFAKGKVLGVLFLQESLRTSASLKAGIIKAGGGWIEFDRTYLKEGEESLEDTIKSIIGLCDFLAIRGGVDVSLEGFKLERPVINAMFGMEHTIGVLWMLYSFFKKTKKIEGLKVGVYGMSRYSRPAHSFYYILSKLNTRFYEDSVLPEVGISKDVVEYIKQNGSTFERKPLEEFIGEVDFLFIPEGLPVKGADKNLVNEFNRRFKPIDREMLKRLRHDAFFIYSMPRALTDGRLVALEEVDDDKRLLTYDMMEKSVFVNIGIFKWLLD